MPTIKPVNLPSPPAASTTPIDNQPVPSVGASPEITQKDTKTSYLFVVLGVAILGASLALIGVAVAGYSFPEIVQEMPYASSIYDTMHSSYNYIYELFAVKAVPAAGGGGSAATGAGATAAAPLITPQTPQTPSVGEMVSDVVANNNTGGSAAVGQAVT